MAEDILVYKANGVVTAKETRGLIKINPYFTVTQKKGSDGKATDGVDTVMSGEAKTAAIKSWSDEGSKIQNATNGVSQETLKAFMDAGNIYKAAKDIPAFYIEAENAKIVRQTPLKTAENANGAKMSGSAITPSIIISFQHTMMQGEKESWSDYTARRSSFLSKYEDKICLVTSEMFADAIYMQFTDIESQIDSGETTATFKVELQQLDEESVLYAMDKDFATTYDQEVADAQAQNSGTDGSNGDVIAG
jgi:hypothetical protein